VILVDPPRAGLDDETREYVAKFDQILYISCNPLALKQDLGRLGEGFEVVALAVFDMFPYTTHVECAVRIRRSQAQVPRPLPQRRSRFRLWWLLVIGAVVFLLKKRRKSCYLLSGSAYGGS